MNLTVNILEAFISSMDLSGDVSSLVNDGTNTTLTVDDPYHTREGMTIQVDTVDQTVISVSGNDIEVSGVLASATTYLVPNPFYFHGTPIATNSHINGAKDKNKVPMIYLYEILREKDLPVTSGLARESDLRLFFLDNADFDRWDTDDHYSKRLIGLNNLVDAFRIEALKYPGFFLDETTFTRINHVKWGVYKDNKGHEQRIFDDDLTGVELSFTLPLRKCN